MSQNKQKILFVITKATWGGAQKYVFDLATALSNDFDIVVAYGTAGELSQRLQAEHIRTIQIDSLGRDIKLGSDIGSFFKLYSIFRKEKPNVIHLNSSKIGGLGALAGRLAGIKKIIFTAHGWAFNEDRSTFSKNIVWFLSWLTALFSHKIIVLGEKEKKQTLSMPLIGSKKVSLIRLGVSQPDLISSQVARQELASILNKPSTFFDNKIIVGTIAELVKNKGLEYALEAIKNIPNILYIDIGNGDQRDNLEKKIIELGLEDRAFLAGFIKDASRLLQAFDIFLVSSVKEGLPYVILESALAQVPIVATNVGAIPEVIESNVSGILVEPKNPQAIEQAITSLVNDNHKRLMYAQKLYIHVSETFNKRIMIEATKEMYRI